jgi:tRNA(Ile2) C34 agmatinyltransferase TiaS
MALHYKFDDPLDLSGMLRGIAKDVDEDAESYFPYGKQPVIIGIEGIAAAALREAADKIEAAVYKASTLRS